MNNLYTEIKNLISLKQEGSYWDFKGEWYNKSEKNDMLHDIICMSNNLENRDAYIIIGVDDKTFELNDISNDANRKNTQNLVDFLKDKKFAGDIRPTVIVQQLIIEANKTIDVIIVKNTKNTPYYLKESYQGVFANNIYTRIQDNNTAKNRSADIDKIEYLWKKRFGLLDTPIEQIENYLLDVDSWINGPNGEMQKYYKFRPEFTIKYESDDSRDAYMYYHFFQCDSHPRYSIINIYYHQTLLTSFDGTFLDGGRYVSPCPESDGINLTQNPHWDIRFKYMEKDSLLFKLNRFLFKHEYTHEAEIARKKFFKAILLFENKEHRMEFKDYVKANWCSDYEKYCSEIHLPYIPDIDGYNMKAYEEDCRIALVLQIMLNDFNNLTQNN